jgi:hypothetical protein
MGLPLLQVPHAFQLSRGLRHPKSIDQGLDTIVYIASLNDTSWSVSAQEEDVERAQQAPVLSHQGKAAIVSNAVQIRNYFAQKLHYGVTVCRHLHVSAARGTILRQKLVGLPKALKLSVKDLPDVVLVEPYRIFPAVLRIPLARLKGRRRSGEISYVLSLNRFRTCSQDDATGGQ